jgi:hypothetical protein
VSHIHIRIHRWVLWWLCLGVVVGAVALVNILFRDLTRTQDKVILVLGIMHWVLGGLVCWAYDGVSITPAPPLERSQFPPIEDAKEWHAASDFILPGGRKSLLPPRF